MLALLEQFPEADRASLSLAEIEKMVRLLPSFADVSCPAPRVLQAILWQWMKMADRDDRGGEAA